VGVVSSTVAVIECRYQFCCIASAAYSYSRWDWFKAEWLHHTLSWPIDVPIDQRALFVAGAVAVSPVQGADNKVALREVQYGSGNSLTISRGVTVSRLPSRNPPTHAEAMSVTTLQATWRTLCRGNIGG
jgi:hypothetical protein